MAYIAGMIVIDAPASALNNLGQIAGERDQNQVGVKVIRARDGRYVYVSAQAYRYWLRRTLESAAGENGWKAAPIFREQKIAYTDGNPIEWWDDDLLGYMRAASKKRTPGETKRRGQTEKEEREGDTGTDAEITRASPFRMGTLVALAPGEPTTDFGTMSRHDGDPVPHEHQFYRAALAGQFSLSLSDAGTFRYQDRSGFRNLDDIRQKLAGELGLEHLEQEKAYRLPLPDRVARTTTLVRALGTVSGGAKQALHYTDTTPAIAVVAAFKGGNNPLRYVIGHQQGQPVVNTDAVAEIFDVWGDTILSAVIFGWASGYREEAIGALRRWLEGEGAQYKSKIEITNPREAFGRMADVMAQPASASWYD